MKTLVGAEFKDDNTLDCSVPQCPGCPCRKADLEAVPHQYPTEAVADEQADGSFVVVVGEMTDHQLETLREAVEYKKSGLCERPGI